MTTKDPPGMIWLDIDLATHRAFDFSAADLARSVTVLGKSWIGKTTALRLCGAVDQREDADPIPSESDEFAGFQMARQPSDLLSQAREARIGCVMSTQ